MKKPFKPTVKQAEEVRRLVEKWQPVLFLQEWHFTYEFLETDDEEDAVHMASITADATYKEATIRVRPAVFRKDAANQDRIILHELCHCVVDPTNNLAYDALVRERFVSWRIYKEANERVTTLIANIVKRLSE